MSVKSFIGVAAVAAVTGVGGSISSSYGAVFGNGSFESPLTSNGSRYIFDGEFLGPWRVSVPPLMAAEFIRGAHFGLAPFEGNQFISFNGDNSTPGAWVHQDFDTNPNTTYRVTFAVGRLGATGGVLGLQATAFDGSNVLSSMSGLALPVDVGWQTHSFEFTATGLITRLQFADASVDTIERDVALDGVTVTVVPAPSAAAALLGLSGLLAARRRR
jgi:hypothetical protein